MCSGQGQWRTTTLFVGPARDYQEEGASEEVRANSEKPFHQDLMRKENKTERKGPIINTQTMQLKQLFEDG